MTGDDGAGGGGWPLAVLKTPAWATNAAICDACEFERRRPRDKKPYCRKLTGDRCFNRLLDAVKTSGCPIGKHPPPTTRNPNRVIRV